MLAGMLFAVHDAEDRPAGLAATLPFAGTTLVEYQARLLIAAGASQIVLVVARLTPELLGAIGRIGRRGVAVDAVRGAAEAIERLHPLARILVLADGLVTTEALLRPLAADGPETLLVIGEGDAPASFERLGGRAAWAGVARIGTARLRDIAGLPFDWDVQSALLRASSQGGATQLIVPAAAVADGHGIEFEAAALARRARAVLSGAISERRGWFDRWITAPVGRRLLPSLAGRGVSAGAVAAGSGASGLAALLAINAGWTAAGLLLAIGAVIAWALGETLARLHDEQRLARGQAAAALILPALSVLLLASAVSVRTGELTAVAVAAALLAFAALGERAVATSGRRLFWGAPGAYLVLILAGAAVGTPVIGLAAAAIYAAATLGGAIEVLREQA